MTCVECGKDIPAGEEYACVWIPSERGLRVGFVHLACSEDPKYEDITEEITGYSVPMPPSDDD
jgi:hypothetical protein